MSRFECEKCGYKTNDKGNFDRHVRTWMDRDCGKREKLKPKIFEKSFASHPKSIHWHPTMNGEVKPQDVFISTKDKFWFKCDKCPHNFQTSLSHISSKNGTWCPYCSPTSKILCKDLECQFCHENSFASCEKSNHWHPTMNGKSKPRDFLKSCDAKGWFKCDKCPHDFEGYLKHITNGVWCPYCSDPPKKLCQNSECQICLSKSFASQPEAKVWHPTENLPITPRDVMKGVSTKKYWFQCKTCSHDYENTILATRGNTLGCPYCSNQMRCKDINCRICFDNSFASHPSSIHWHPTMNGDTKPRDIAKRTHDEYWFKCLDCHHEFKKPVSFLRVKNDIEGWGCPYCSKTHRKLCDDVECQFCYENSFASHPKSIHWHPTMNGDLEPIGVTRCNDLKVWFKCDTCPHNFEATISHINGGTWCPYCVEPVKKLCKDKSCHHCLLKSFASHPRADQWHPTKNHPITPRDVARGSSTQKYWFKCDKCPHDFLGDLANISSSGQWCPYCRGNELCDATGCDFCFKKSFASHPKAIHWHPTENGDLKPRDICMAANRKVWFNCDVCLEPFDTMVARISLRGGWCGKCKFKTEKKVYDDLINHYPKLERGLRVDWCKNPETNCYYPFDFCIKEKSMIIELDGRHHFEDVKYWKSSFEDRHAVDLIKQLDANDNGFRVIRLIQEDVWSDKYDWLTELLCNIEDDTKQNIFMCKNGEYDFFSESMEMITSEGQHPPCNTSSP